MVSRLNHLMFGNYFNSNFFPHSKMDMITANIRLVDRRIIPGFYRGHIDFNVQSVINDWQNQLPNYGLMIRVNDSVSNRISPFRFIHQMNCSG